MPATAQDTWSGVSNAAWDTATNWSLTFKPRITDDVIFPTVPATGATITMGAGELAKSLTFNDTYVLGATAGSGDITNATGVVTVAAGKTATLNSQLVGSGGLTINGTGTVALSTNTNSNFSGGVTVNSGTLQLASDNPLGSVTANAVTTYNNLTFNGGTVNSVATSAYTINAGRRLIVNAGGGTFNIAAGVTFSGSFEGTGDLLVGGTATRVLSLQGNVSNYSGQMTVAAGSNVIFGETTTDLPVVVLSTATAIGGVGTTSTTSFGNFTVNRTSGPSYGGVFAINTSAYNGAIQMDQLGNSGGVYLGSTGTGVYTSDLLTPDGTVYRLGGGGGQLTFNSTVLQDGAAGATSVVIGDPRINGGGTIVLGSQDSNFTGDILVNQGSLSVSSLAFFLGSSTLGAGLGPVTLGSDTTSGTLSLLAAATGAETTQRPIAVGAGGGVINVASSTASVTVAGFSGTGTLGKTGPGSLLSSVSGPVTIGGISVTDGYLNLSPGAAAVTITGSLAVSKNSGTGIFAVTPGSTLSIGSGSTSFLDVGSRDSTTGGVTNGLLDASGAASFTANVNAVRIQFDTSAGNSALMQGQVKLPTAATAVNSITASTAVTVGDSLSAGPTAVATLNLGGGSTTIVTPTMLVGGKKSSALVDLDTGGTLTLNGGGASATTTLTVGSNAVNGTSTTPISTMDLSKGTFIARLGALVIGSRTLGPSGAAGTENASLILGTSALNNVTAGAVTVGLVNAGGVGNGTLTINGGSFSATSMVLASFTSSGTSTGTLNIGGGTVTLTGALTDGGTGGTSIINLTGGTLNMSGNSIANATNAISTFNFSGGTLKNLATLTQPAFAQTGPTSVLDVADNNAALTGTYSLTNGSANIAATRTLAVTGAMTVNGTSGKGRLNIRGTLSASSLALNSNSQLTGTGVINAPITAILGSEIAPGNSGIGTLSISRAVTLGAASGTGRATLTMELGASSGVSDVLALTGTTTNGAFTLAGSEALDLVPLFSIGSTPQTFTLATFVSRTGTFDFSTVNGVTAQSADTNLANYVNIVYNTNNIQVTVANLAVVPEPGAAGMLATGVCGLLGFRRFRQRRA